MPFEVKRFFLVFDVTSEQIRGEHAHRTLHQFLVCVHGRCCVVADDGAHRQEFILDSPALGLYLPPMTWAVQYKYTRDAVLLVLASDVYDPAEYIRDYEEFLRSSRRRMILLTISGASGTHGGPGSSKPSPRWAKAASTSWASM